MGLSQHTYVEKVLKYYKDNDIQPGDPNEGSWHRAHYPGPKCLGYSQEILLLEEHHAVQGVLQSEEYGVCCLSSWEYKYLDGWLLERWRYWRNQCSSAVGRKLVEEGKGLFGMSEEDKDARNSKGGKEAFRQRKGWHNKDDPRCKEGSRKGGVTQGKIQGRKNVESGHWARLHSIGGKIGGKVTGSQRWQSLIDPSMISNASGIVRAHNKRGWDPDARILLN